MWYFRFHTIRQHGATVMGVNNDPNGTITIILGHTNRKTTESYMHRINDAEREVMGVLEQVRTESHTK